MTSTIKRANPDFSPKKRIGAPNQRKLFCDNDFCLIRGTPRCRQSVTQTCLDSHLSAAEKLWEVLTAAR
jgi:hypothetical protein